jgi:hypothetical protein
MRIHFSRLTKIKKSTNHNSGVRFDAVHDNRTKDTYYGYIEEIWELDYEPSFKVPLFRCKWVKLTGGRVVVDQKYGIITVDLNNLAYIDEPFILANDVAQVFYVKDMSTKSRKKKIKKRIHHTMSKSDTLFSQGKESSWEWRTRQICQKIITTLMKFCPSE